MNKSTKIAIACAATYAIVGFNTLGFKYHHQNVPLPEDTEWQRREARALNSGFAAVFWPLYWPARWSLLFWEPRPAAVTNTVYVTNYIRQPISYNILPHYVPLPNNDILPRFETNWSMPYGTNGNILVMTNNQWQWLNPN